MSQAQIHAPSRGINKRSKRKRVLARGIDLIYEDVKPENAEKFKNLPIDDDLPGLGQHYCIQCSRYFVSDEILKAHTRSKAHKKRLKELKEEPYSHREAEAAAGMGPPDNGKTSKDKMQT
eukprot:tig00001530_g9264.t1